MPQQPSDLPTIEYTAPETAPGHASVDIDLASARPLSSFDLGEASLSVSLDRPGRQNGHLTLPRSDSRAAIAQLQIPLTVLVGRNAGPTVLLMAGVHGDEADGVLCLQRLAREIAIDDVRGRIIIVPALNLPAVLENRRGTQDDGGNLDGCFPGGPEGSTGERLAHATCRLLLAEADLVVDLRAGGQSLAFAPMVAIRRTPKSDAYTLAEQAMVAFGAPNSVYLPSELAAAALPGLLERDGVGYVQASLGGAGDVTLDALNIAYTGCTNMLISLGVLAGDMQLRATRTLALPGKKAWVFAPASGLLEPRARLGAEVYRGDPLACIVDPEQSGGAVKVIDVPLNGVLLARRAGTHVRAGDLVALVADEIQP